MTQLVVVASQNKHKIKEIEEILKKFGYTAASRDEIGLPKIKIVEDGDTFEDNSLKKAREISMLCNQITIADDSGLMVEVLDGAPGVYSSRYAGEEGNDEKNNDKLLAELAGIPKEKRRAKYVAVLTMIFPKGKKLVARGECHGYIQEKRTGSNGFGYDPIFVPDGYDVSMAELSPEEKNTISHRAKALEELRKQLEENKGSY